MTAPPKPTDQERAKAAELAGDATDYGYEQHRDEIAQALADHAATARAEERRRCAAVAREHGSGCTNACGERIAAAIEKETT